MTRYASLVPSLRRWFPLFLSLVAGLYISRVFIEFAPLDWPGRWMGLAGLGLAGVGFLLTLMVRAFGGPVTPLALLSLYLITPSIDPDRAASLGFLALAGLLIQGFVNARVNPLRHISRPEIVLFALMLVLYWVTLAPGLLPADSGEFQLVASTLGIAHPPGYALYTLVGKLVTLFPLGTPAYRLNLLSALLAATTLALVYRITRQLTHSVPASLVAMGALAGAPTFWSQATTANIRMPTAFFTALILGLVIRYAEEGNERDLIGAAFATGLGLTHHVSLFFLVPPIVLYLLSIDPRVLLRGRLILHVGLAFVLALLVLLYFPLRGAEPGAPLNPGGLTTLDGFLNHVLALGFRGDMLAFTRVPDLLDRTRVLANILLMQFQSPLLLWMAGSGLVLLFSAYRLLFATTPYRNRQGPAVSRLRLAILHASYLPTHMGTRFFVRHWALLAGISLLMAGAAITYRAPQTVEYLMPAYIPLAILAGLGAILLARLFPSPTLQALILAAALWPGLTNIWRHAPSFRELHRESDTRAYAEPILRDAPANTILFSNWHWAPAFWYLQTIEGQRPDVQVEYIAPAGAEPYPETWRRRLAEALRTSPTVLVTNRYATYASLPARIVPFHDAFLITTTPVEVPAAATTLDASFEDVITLKGFRLSQSTLQPGEELTVYLWWQPQVQAERDYSVFVHLVDETGRPIGQADVRYAAGRLTPETLIEDAYKLTILPTVPPGTYTVLAGFYFTPSTGGFQRLTTDGQDAVRLGTIQVAPRYRPPVTRRRLHVPFAAGPTLKGVDVDTSRSEALRVYLHWQATGAGPWEVTLLNGDQPIGQTTLPPAPAGTYLTTATDVPPDVRDLRLTLADTAGTPLPGLGAWRWPLLGTQISLPTPAPADRYLIWGGEMALVQARWEKRDDEWVVDLEWLSLKPLIRDYTVSVQLLGETGWQAQQDGTPALGAIPTLKWIRGTRITDRHRVPLPTPDGGPARLQVSVYDAFTQAPLSILDDRFQRLGQGQAAILGRLE